MFGIFDTLEQPEINVLMYLNEIKALWFIREQVATKLLTNSGFYTLIT